MDRASQSLLAELKRCVVLSEPGPATADRNKLRGRIKAVRASRRVAAASLFVSVLARSIKASDHLYQASTRISSESLDQASATRS